MQAVLNALKPRVPLSKAEREHRAYERARNYVRLLVEERGFGENTIRVLHTMAEKIAFLHERHPETKGNYSLLTYRYWTTFCGIKISFDDFERIVRAPSPDSIGRVSRFFQENGFFQPSFKTVLKREAREGIFRGFFAGSVKD